MAPVTQSSPGERDTNSSNKLRKLMVEKVRRDRINHSIEQLRSLLHPAAPPSGQGPSRLHPAAPPSGQGPSRLDPAAPPSGQGPSRLHPAAPPSGQGPSRLDPAAPPSGQGPSRLDPAAPPSGQGPSRLEKADILELSVGLLRRRALARAGPSYAQGFSQCLQETLRHLSLHAPLQHAQREEIKRFYVHQRATLQRHVCGAQSRRKWSSSRSHSSLWRPW